LNEAIAEADREIALAPAASPRSAREVQLYLAEAVTDDLVTW